MARARARGPLPPRLAPPPAPPPPPPPAPPPAPPLPAPPLAPPVASPRPSKRAGAPPPGGIAARLDRRRAFARRTVAAARCRHRTRATGSVATAQSVSAPRFRADRTPQTARARRRGGSRARRALRGLAETGWSRSCPQANEPPCARARTARHAWAAFRIE